MVQRARPQGKRGRAPRWNARFPSQVFGDNVHAIRRLKKMKQEDLSERMVSLGHPGWSRVTVSDVERAQRGTSIDELFALAIALETSVAKLLDPGGVAGVGSTDLDFGLNFVPAASPTQGRSFIVSTQDPWNLRKTDMRVIWVDNKPTRVIWEEIGTSDES
jgi:transcriptional regulator with XRE-family HTH domain